MRIYVSSMAHPKRLAKRLAKEAAIPLNRAQFACSVMLGYKDWHELEQVTGAQLSPPSKPDWLLPTEIRTTRRNAFGVRLRRALDRPLAENWSGIWDLVDHLDPTGTIPDEDAFFDPRINEIFPVDWLLSEDAMAYFDSMPSVPMLVSVGQTASRQFETIIKEAAAKSQAIQPNAFVPEDRFGFRTFVVDFDNRAPFIDINPKAPGVAMLPIRFVPTISEGVLLELELSVHPGALASYHLDDEATDLIAEAVVSYLRESNIWGLSTGNVCGATNGILLTLSGQVASSPVMRIMSALMNKFDEHSEAFDPDMEFDEEARLFLPIRDVVFDLDEEIPEDDSKRDFVAQNGRSILDRMLRETIALSKLPQLLKRILNENGFAQYAEFCDGMSTSTFEDRKKLSAFICSMERANVLRRDMSLFFRHHLVDLLIGEYERSRGIPAKDVTDDSNLVPVDAVAAMARSLGDEEMAVLIEKDYDGLFTLLRQVAVNLDDLIEEFSQN